MQRTGNNDLQVAISTKKIKDCSIDELSQGLRYVMVKVGLRAANWPDDFEKQILLKHIFDGYGGHHVDEIKLAFDMAIAGSLEIDDVNCFENFSCVYFSKIMNAYRKWSAQEYKELKTEQPVVQNLLTDQQIEDLQRKDIEDFYQRCRSGKIPHCVPEYFKEILVKDGLLKAEESVSNFFVQRLGRQSENIYLPV